MATSVGLKRCCNVIVRRQRPQAKRRDSMKASSEWPSGIRWPLLGVTRNRADGRNQQPITILDSRGSTGKSIAASQGQSTMMAALNAHLSSQPSQCSTPYGPLKELRNSGEQGHAEGHFNVNFEQCVYNSLLNWTASKSSSLSSVALPTPQIHFEGGENKPPLKLMDKHGCREAFYVVRWVGILFDTL